MDITKTKKNRVIDLRKKKIVSTQKPIYVTHDSEYREREEGNKQIIIPVIKPFQAGTFPCVSCGNASAQEFGRCQTCDTQHMQLAASLDARAIKIPEKIPQKLSLFINIDFIA